MSLEHLGLHLLKGVDLILRNVLTFPPIGEEVDMDLKGLARHHREVGEVIHLALREVVEKWIILYELIELLVVWSILCNALAKCICRKLLLASHLSKCGCNHSREVRRLLGLRPEDPHLFHLREGDDLSVAEWESTAFEEARLVQLGESLLTELCSVLEDLRKKRVSLVNIHKCTAWLGFYIVPRVGCSTITLEPYLPD